MTCKRSHEDQLLDCEIVSYTEKWKNTTWNKWQYSETQLMNCIL